MKTRFTFQSNRNKVLTSSSSRRLNKASEEKLVICYKFFESKYYRGETTASALTISWYENKYPVLRVPRGTENGIQNDQATIASYWLHNTASNKQQRQVQVSRNHQNQVNILEHWTNQEYNSNLQLQQQQQTSLQIFDFNSSSSSNITWEHHSKESFKAPGVKHPCIKRAALSQHKLRLQPARTRNKDTPSFMLQKYPSSTEMRKI